MARPRLPWLACLLVVCLAAASPARAADEPVLVFAAASLATAFEAMRAGFERAADTTVRFSYAASATLARQIEAGAPADLFVSADVEWMNYLVERRLVRREGALSAIAFNRLVLVAPAASTVALRITRGFPIRAALGSGRLAVGDPASVPAGKYAKAALEHFDAWAAVQDRLAPGENVRVALQFVAHAECPLGIVYESDAVAEPGVRIVDTFPDDSHPVIQYPAGLVASRSNPAAGRVLAWLQTTDARRLLARHGFRVDGPDIP